MQDMNSTKTQRRGKRAKPVQQITELHTSKAKRTGDEAAQEREYWKQAIIDSIPGVAWLKDKEYRFVAVNERLREAFGMRAEDLIGKTDFDVWPRDLAEQFRADDEEVMNTGKPKRVEKPWGLADGDRIWIETIKTPIFDEKGEVIATSGIAHDITDRKRAEEALQKSESEKSLILDSLSELIIYQDKNLRVVWTNRAAAESVGLSPDKLVGGRCYEIWHQRDQPCVDCPVKKSIETGQPHEREMSTPDKRIWRVQGYPVRVQNGDVVGAVEVVLNITERKRAEKRRQRLTEVLKEKNRELEQIIRVATHDMRTPMVNIEGFGRILASSCAQIQALIEGRKISDELKKQLDEIIGVDIPEAVGIMNLGVSKMNSLLDSLLRLAKLGYSATEIMKLDMNTKVENILDTMKFQVEQSGAEIKVEPLPSCLGDKAQIDQVFSNLLANALNYLDSSRPGSVRISGQNRRRLFGVLCPR